ncbi:hypothetical protein quinque_006096 [Culex quinquefasciatus]
MGFKWLRKLLNPTNFYAAQRPVLRTTFITGMTPFTVFTNGTDSVLKCTTFGYLNSCLHSILFCTCYVIALLKQESVTGYFFNTEISSLGDILQIWIGIVALVMTFAYSIFQRDKLIDAFHSLAKTDQHFKEIGVETNYQSTLYYNYLLIVMSILIQISYCTVCVLVLASSNVYPCITAWMSFFLPFLMMSMVIVLFVCLVNQTRHRFHLLNKVLKSLRDISNDKQLAAYNEKQESVKVVRIRQPLGISSVFSNTNRYMPEVINRVANIQDELCDACNCVEEYFKVQMLAIVTISFLIAVFDSYYILETIFTDGHNNTPFSKLQFVMFFLYQGAVHMIGVVKIVFVSNKAVKENEKIAVNVHKLMNVNKYDEDLTKQLAQLSLQLTHRKVSFTAHGFFKLDFTLLFTLVGAATTYLVILVQFTLNQNEMCTQMVPNSTVRSMLNNSTNNA